VSPVRTNFYVDVFNLYYGSLEGTPHKSLDLATLFRRVFRRNELNRIRYCNRIQRTLVVRPEPIAPRRRPVHGRYRSVPCRTRR
jgi:hypothetical protein